MCGIAGALWLDGAPVERSLVTRMTDTMAHRGPDQSGFHFDEGFAMGHRRLSLSDPAGGSQPLSDARGAVWVCANAEIYNHIELRSRLKPIPSACDVAVVPSLYQRHGLDFASHLDGMFGLALWDSPRRLLVLARDPHGIKPLHYYHDDRVFLFASELRALLCYGRLDPTLNARALDQYCRFMAVLDPDTILAGVRKVPQGCMLLVQEGKLTIRPYRSRGQAAPLATTLRHGVRSSLRADAPLGVFLSGGLDSSLIAALAVEAAGPIRTYSIAFSEPQADESSFSRMVARHLGSRHQEVLFGESLAVEVALEWTDHQDEPMADSSALACWLLARRASQDVKAVLTGDGADELFGGYPWHRAGPLQPEGLVPFLEHDFLPLFTADQRRQLYRQDLAEVIRGVDVFESLHLDKPRLAQLGGLAARLELDLATYLPSDLMVKVDRTTMAHSLEARVPYLNRSVVASARALCEQSRLDKAALREELGGLLPRAVLERPKKGFGIPIGLWLWKPGLFRDLVFESLRDPRARLLDLFEARAIERLLREHDRFPVHGHRLWALFVLERWLQRYGATPGLSACSSRARCR